MKRYEELTKEELAALSEEQTDQLIELEAAYQEVQPIVAPEIPKLSSVGLVARDRAWEIGSTRVFVKTEEEAKVLQTLTLFASDYNWKHGSDKMFLKPILGDAAQEKFLFRHEDIISCSKALEEFETKKKDYEHHKELYDQYLTLMSSIREDVWGAIREAKNWFRDLAHAHQEWGKYLALAEGNTAIAMNFFKGCFKTREDLIEAVQTEVLAAAAQED